MAPSVALRILDEHMSPLADTSNKYPYGVVNVGAVHALPSSLHAWCQVRLPWADS